MPINLNVSKNILLAISAVIIILVLFFLIFWESQPEPGKLGQEPDRNDQGRGRLILDGKKVPISPELTKFIKEGGYAMLTLTNGKDQVKIVGPDGAQIDPCGRIEGTTVTGTCDVKELNFESVNEVLVLGPVESNKCTIERIGSYLIQY